MARRILLMNSDLAANRGDRAIAEGIVALVRSRDPEARITGISQYPERDGRWYDIDVLDMDFQSLSPFAWLRLLREARRHDVVLWGGGEILKDYTNKAALWYWVVKMTMLSFVNRKVVGAFQGIGPTRSASSRRLIALVVGRCRRFIVRDDESRDKLLGWGVDAGRVLAASDPAVLPRPEPMSQELRASLVATYGLADDFFDDVVCIGPRDWFHYKQSGLLPFKYRQALLRRLGRDVTVGDERHEAYLASLRSTVREVAQASGSRLLFLPMHMGEADTALCHDLAAAVGDLTQTCVLDQDDLGPAELRSVISSARAMVGFRLHSNIIAISSGVPSINVYYVDKGRVFFDQVGMSRYALPIEDALEDGFGARVGGLLTTLLAESDEVRASLEEATAAQRASVAAAYDEALRVL